MSEQTKRTFAQKLSSVLYDAFKQIAGSMNQAKVEALHTASSNLATVIERGSEEKAVEICKKIQEVTKDAFISMGRDIEMLEKRVNDLSENMEAIAATNKAFFMALHGAEEAEEGEPETVQPCAVDDCESCDKNK